MVSLLKSALLLFGIVKSQTGTWTACYGCSDGTHHGSTETLETSDNANTYITTICVREDLYIDEISVHWRYYLRQITYKNHKINKFYKHK